MALNINEKIKNIFIKNSYSTSTTDGYSANYINQITSAINVRMSSSATITTSNTSVTLTFDTINAQKGTSLTNSNGAVVIGDNVDYVLVSLNVMVQTIGTVGNKRFIIQKNGTDVARSMINEQNTNANYQTVTIPPFLLKVSSGDVISVIANCTGTDTVIGSGYRDTYLNVMAI